MHMEESKIDKLIARILKHEATTQEQLDFQQMMEKDESIKKKYKSAAYIWENASEIDVDTDAAWQRFKSKAIDKKQPVNLIFSYRKYAAAASIVLFSLIGLSLGYRYLTGTITVQTASNEMKQIQMRDGSEIYLYASSSITYPRYIIRDKREIKLTGEAFFEVAPNPEKPFIIEASNSTTEVLGTSFIVKSKSEMDELHVRTGKVKFDTQKGSKGVFTAGMSAVITNSGDLNEVVQDDNVFAFHQKKLIFTNSKMSYVIQTVSEYFHVSIKTENEAILNCTLTAEFNNPSLNEVLKVLEKTLGLTNSKVQGVIIISGEGCK